MTGDRRRHLGRCTDCGALADVSDDHQGYRAGDARLPERPAYW